MCEQERYKIIIKVNITLENFLEIDKEDLELTEKEVKKIWKENLLPDFDVSNEYDTENISIEVVGSLYTSDNKKLFSVKNKKIKGH